MLPALRQGSWLRAYGGISESCRQVAGVLMPRLSISLRAEDSPSGLGRTLGKRVGGNPSRVRISYPPPS